jgi:hypothetical protein
MRASLRLLPCKGRGTARSAVEGYRPVDLSRAIASAIPLHHASHGPPPPVGEETFA